MSPSDGNIYVIWMLVKHAPESYQVIITLIILSGKMIVAIVLPVFLVRTAISMKLAPVVQEKRPGLVHHRVTSLFTCIIFIIKLTKYHTWASTGLHNHHQDFNK